MSAVVLGERGTSTALLKVHGAEHGDVGRVDVAEQESSLARTRARLGSRSPSSQREERDVVALRDGNTHGVVDTHAAEGR